MKTARITVLLSVLVCHAAASETVRMAIYQLEPFNTVAGERSGHRGITVDYWREYIAPRMGVGLEVVGPFPIKRIESMLENGEVDVISHLTKIPEREAVFLFPNTHLTEITICMAVLRDSPITAVRRPEDLFDRRIGFIKSAYIPPLLVHERIAFDLISSEDYREVQLKMLIARRVDAVLDLNLVSFVHYLRQYGYEDKVRVLPLPVEKVKVYSIFGNTERGRRLRKAFDEANGEGLKNGVYEKFVRQYMDRGPGRP